MQNEIKKNWRQLLLRATVGMALFTVIGLGIPHMYFQYFDKRELVKIEDSLSFDRKLYHPCDEIITTVNFASVIDTEVESQTIMYKIENNKAIQIGQPRRTKRILSKDNQLKPLLITSKLSCDLKPGTYYWDIAYQYYYKGHRRQGKAQTALITILPKETYVPKL